MLFNTEIKNINLCGKQVYIFESHHYALYPWALLKRKYLKTDVNLFSFDYHTDTNNPFLKYAYDKKNKTINDSLQLKLIREIDFQYDTSLRNAIEKLNNDEHILTAIQCGIIKQAFIVSHLGSEKPQSYEERERIEKCYSDESIMQQIEGTYRITPREERTYPPSDIYITDFLMSDVDDGDEVADVLLEDDFLHPHFNVLSRMSNIVGMDGNIVVPYILDIDLDYFTSKKSVSPNNTNIFLKLVQNAEIITIAKESACVDFCSKGKVNSEYLLEHLLPLLEQCLIKNKGVKTL